MFMTAVTVSYTGMENFLRTYPWHNILSMRWIIPSHKIFSSSNSNIVPIILNYDKMFSRQFICEQCSIGESKFWNNFLTSISYANMNWKVNQRMYKNIKLLKPCGLSANKFVFDVISFFLFCVRFEGASFSGTTFFGDFLFSIEDLPKKKGRTRITLFNPVLFYWIILSIQTIWTVLSVLEPYRSLKFGMLKIGKIQ